MEELTGKRPEESEANPSKYLGYREAAGFLNARGVTIAEATLRRMVCQRRIRFYKPFKKVFFSERSLVEWVESTLVEPRA